MTRDAFFDYVFNKGIGFLVIENIPLLSIVKVDYVRLENSCVSEV